jgi:hypothetical protein
MKGGEMSGACGMHDTEEKRNAFRVFGGKTWKGIDCFG